MNPHPLSLTVQHLKLCTEDRSFLFLARSSNQIGNEKDINWFNVFDLQ